MAKLTNDQKTSLILILWDLAGEIITRIKNRKKKNNVQTEPAKTNEPESK